MFYRSLKLLYILADKVKVGENQKDPPYCLFLSNLQSTSLPEAVKITNNLYALELVQVL